jgi:hypothetical protein
MFHKLIHRAAGLVLGVLLFGCAMTKQTYVPYKQFDKYSPLESYQGIVNAQFDKDGDLVIDINNYQLLQEYFYSPSQTERSKTEVQKIFPADVKEARVRIEGIKPEPFEFTLRRNHTTITTASLLRPGNNKVVVYCLSCKSLKIDNYEILDRFEVSETPSAVLKRVSQDKKRKAIEASNEELRQTLERNNQAEKLAKSKLELAEKNNLAEKSKIDDAKLKCENLGFKLGTEGMGRCVLQITK